MNIEITEKEKTALSLLLGLRLKFGNEKKENITYSAKELHLLFTELLDKINKGEIKYLDSLRVTPEPKPNPVWDTIDRQIERSTIRRYDWKGVFNGSLTQEILKLKKSGKEVLETFNILRNDKRVIEFLEKNKAEKENIIKNLEISVHARYGENNTAIKVMETEDDK